MHATGHAEVFLGYDRDTGYAEAAMADLPGEIRALISRMDGEQPLWSDDGKLLVKSLKSTDLGVAFLLEFEGKKIYHAGDLFLMPARTREDVKEFEQYTEPLRGMKIDYGMLPLDPRFPDIGYLTVRRYLELAEFTAWTPMHLWGQYDFPAAFAAENPSLAQHMCALKAGERMDLE
ncbi:MAG: hypothetical protein K6E92_07170 [Lachnospiraceae bacterium]|nr:hypothetical protein [Lachnospiraceae bacterium]